MTTAIFAAEFFAIAVALWLIAWGVLHPKYQVSAQATPAPSRRDVTYINVNRAGAGVNYRKAYGDGYRTVARDGDWITMRRNGE